MLVMVALALAGIALIRSTDTTTTVSGNLVLKQAATSAVDRGIEQTIYTLWEASPSLDRTQHDAAKNYYACVRGAAGGCLAAGTAVPKIPDLLKSASGCAGTGLTAGLVANDDAGNTSCFVIERMCLNTGSAVGSNCNLSTALLRCRSRDDSLHGTGPARRRVLPRHRQGRGTAQYRDLCAGNAEVGVRRLEPFQEQHNDRLSPTRPFPILRDPPGRHADRPTAGNIRRHDHADAGAGPDSGAESGQAEHHADHGRLGQHGDGSIIPDYIAYPGSGIYHCRDGARPASIAAETRTPTAIQAAHDSPSQYDPPFRSPDYNEAFYDRTITYTPGKKADGTNLPCQGSDTTCVSPWTAVYVNGYDGYPGTNGGGTINLTTGYPDTIWCWKSSAYVTREGDS